MPSILVGKLPFSLVALLVSEAFASLPNNPTRMFAVPRKGRKSHRYYILEPPSNAFPSGRLAAITSASTLQSNSLPLRTVNAPLPFLKDDPSAPYTAVLQSNGTIAVFVGDCSRSASHSLLWIFTPSENSSSGSWQSRSVSADDSIGTDAMSGAQYLASGISFSYNTERIDDVYTFGGMCPSANATGSTWTSEASYSNQLLTARPDGSRYSISADEGQPTPEAGFSITPLQATYADLSDGTQTQQQDFVLIGGHTQQAFIDMNTIAMFSLPQSSWTFIPVDSPGSSTDLTLKRQDTSVDSRSGHTALLSPDRSKIVVFGGWVGDVSNPADPQLAILELGAGYGGSGSWSWSSPSSSLFSSGDGIYGHGAVMLPDSIMLATGGYQIGTSSSNGKIRRAVQSGNDRNYFFNISSGEWLNSYSPDSISGTMSGGHSDGLLRTENQKAGLGAGLGVGIIALICIIVFSILYYRKLKRQREQHADDLWEDREKEIDDLANVAQYDPIATYGGFDGRGGGMGTIGPQPGLSQDRSSAYPWVHDNRRSNVRDAERSGVHIDLPSPQRGLRRSMYNRGHYYMAPRNDDSRYMAGAGDMHAIQERDEENSNASSSRKASSTQQRPDLMINTDRPNLDPFRDPDPPLNSSIGSRTLRRVPTQIRSPPPPEQRSPSEDRQREMCGWIRDWEAAGSGSRSTAADRYSPTKSGRSSPSKSERTRSDLSERSLHSTTSGLLPSRNTSTSRSLIRSYLPSILPAALTNPFTSPSPSPTHTNENLYGPSASSSNPSHASSERANSFTTAQTTISQLQVESENLIAAPRRHQPQHRHNRSSSSGTTLHSALHSSASPAQPRTTGTADLTPDVEPTFTLPRSRTTQAQTLPQTPTSPTRQPRRSSLVGTWVGSVKRGMGKALTGGRTVSLTSDIDRSPRPGGIGANGYYEYASKTPTERERAHGSESGLTVPKKSDLGGLVDLSHPNDGDESLKREKMRRSVSEGGASLWATKRGARDWDVEPIPSRVNERNRSLVPERSEAGGQRPSTAGAEAGQGEPPRSAGMDSVVTRADSLTTGASEDWDVEAAVEGRVVQVMFTVPRERLRVVNADVDASSLNSREERGEVVEVDDVDDGERVREVGGGKPLPELPGRD